MTFLISLAIAVVIWVGFMKLISYLESRNLYLVVFGLWSVVLAILAIEAFFRPQGPISVIFAAAVGWVLTETWRKHTDHQGALSSIAILEEAGHHDLADSIRRMRNIEVPGEVDP